MDAEKQRRLKKLGGRVTTVADLLDLNDAEKAVIELRIESVATTQKRTAAASK
ncbi:MAG: hypothetical protein ABW321_30365 [Polyangiales bacterium]